MKFHLPVGYQGPAARQRTRNRSEEQPTRGGMDFGACRVAGYEAIIGFADPAHARLATSAEQATPLVNALEPACPHGVGVHRLAVSRASRDLTRGCHFRQERRGDEIDRSNLLLLYLGPGGLSRLRSRRADVLTQDGRSSVVKPGPGRREPLRPCSFPRPTEQSLHTRKDDPMRPHSAMTRQFHWLRSAWTDVRALGGATRARSTELIVVRRRLCGRDACPAP
jgi:hypothetical protein